MKEEVKALWKLCFDDSDEFIDLYFKMRYKDELNMAIREEGKVIAALQMLPYPMTFCGDTIATSYISGACTHPDYRGRGAMRCLLNEVHRRMYNDGVWLSTLIPAENWLIDYYGKSGYAPSFGYAALEVAIDKLRPLSCYQIEECTSPLSEHFHYFDARMRGRACCVQHLKEDFIVIMADLKLGDGKLLVARQEDKIVGMAFVAMEGETLCVKELLTDQERISDALLNEAAHIYKVSTLKQLIPSSLNTSFLGMARIIHAQKMLTLFARKYPKAELYIHLEGDEAIAENNGFYSVCCGKCTREPIARKKYHTYGMASFTRLLLEAEHPYMSLMLN